MVTCSCLSARSFSSSWNERLTSKELVSTMPFARNENPDKSSPFTRETEKVELMAKRKERIMKGSCKREKLTRDTGNICEEGATAAMKLRHSLSAGEHLPLSNTALGITKGLHEYLQIDLDFCAIPILHGHYS
ncbi:hypothetical protein KC326_g57 [Hortaea werneckii]|nr:hypothetical protein KC326_g57 [Hortaea werneckii]